MKRTEWNIQDYLKTPEDLANFLESALEENDYEFLKIAVNDVITALRRKELLKNLELLANNVFK
jgi:DNA-binding phage protein